MPRPWSAPALHSARLSRCACIAIFGHKSTSIDPGMLQTDSSQSPPCTVAEAAWSREVTLLIPAPGAPPSDLLAQAQLVLKTTVGGCSASDPPASCEGAP